MLAATLLLVLGALNSAQLNHIEQRVQENLRADGVLLSQEGLSLNLVATSSSSVTVQLDRADGTRQERILENVPDDVDAASVEIGLAVVDMLPKRDGVEPPPPTPKTQTYSSMTEPGATPDPPPAHGAGPEMEEGDRYYVGLAMSICLGFGIGQLVLGETYGVWFLGLQVGALAATVTGIALVVKDKSSNAGVGLIVGGGIAYVSVYLWQLIDYLLLDHNDSLVAVVPIQTRDGFAPAVTWRLEF